MFNQILSRTDIFKAWDQATLDLSENICGLRNALQRKSLNKARKGWNVKVKQTYTFYVLLDQTFRSGKLMVLHFIEMTAERRSIIIISP